MAMKIIREADGKIGYMDDGSTVPDGWSEVSQFERGPSMDESVKGTVKGSNVPEWLVNALGSIGLEYRGSQGVGLGAVQQGLTAGHMMPSPEAIQGLKDSVGPGVGGMAGSAIGGVGAGLLAGPEAIPWGIYGGGIAGAGIGTGISNLVKGESPFQKNVPANMAGEAVLGPLVGGASQALQGVARSTPIVRNFMKDPLEEVLAQNPNITIDLSRLVNTTAKLGGKTRSLIDTVDQASGSVLNNINSLVRQGGQFGHDVGARSVDEIRQLIGKLQENRMADAATGIADPLYGSIMRDLRANAYTDMNFPGQGNPAAQAILQSIGENKAMNALRGGIGKLPLYAGGGTGLLALRYLSSLPKVAAAALLPPTAALAGGLSKVGFQFPQYQAYGAVPLVGNMAYDYMNPQQENPYASR